MKKKKLVKNALKHPELYSEGELAFFELWRKAKKLEKAAKNEFTKDKKEQ